MPERAQKKTVRRAPCAVYCVLSIVCIWELPGCHYPEQHRQLINPRCVFRESGRSFTVDSPEFLAACLLQAFLLVTVSCVS